MFKRYYEDELEYLRALGGEFSRSWPEIAAELGMNARDPDVERLLQGVAFLTAQIRQEQEAHFPALLHPLLELLWPQALRPTPSMGIVQFRPRPGVQQEPVEVSRHARLLSIPVDGTPCEFRTSWPLTVLPISLETFHVEAPSPGRLRLHLRLKSLPNVRQTGLDRHPLRFSLAGSPRQTYGLMLMLTRDLRAVHVRGLDARGQALFMQTLPASSLQQLGWKLEDALLPQPNNGFRGLRHLHEHFLFPARSLHFELAPLGELPGIATLHALELVLDVLATDEEGVQLSRDQLQLFTVPVVNLYTQSARPIALLPERTEYQLLPDVEQVAHVSLYRLLNAWALNPGDGQSIPVQPFMAYRSRAFGGRSSLVDASADEKRGNSGGNNALLYQLQLRPQSRRGGTRPQELSGAASRGNSDAGWGPSEKGGQDRAGVDRSTSDRSSPDRGGIDRGSPDRGGSDGGSVQPGVSPWLSFVTASGKPPPPGVVVSVDMEATHGSLPSRLRPGDLNVSSTELPPSVTFYNLGTFTPFWPAPVGVEDLWRYVTHATVRHQLFQSRKALVTFLALHHLPAMFDQRARVQLEQLLGSIQDVRGEVEQAIVGNPPGLVRGTHILIKIHEKRFVHTGELYLFGLSLSHLFGEMAPLNTFSRLSIQGEDGGLELHYPRRSGRQSLM